MTHFFQWCLRLRSDTSLKSWLCFWCVLYSENKGNAACRATASVGLLINPSEKLPLFYRTGFFMLFYIYLKRLITSIIRLIITVIDGFWETACGSRRLSRPCLWLQSAFLFWIFFALSDRIKKKAQFKDFGWSSSVLAFCSFEHYRLSGSDLGGYFFLCRLLSKSGRLTKLDCRAIKARLPAKSSWFGSPHTLPRLKYDSFIRKSHKS